jgi:hypothetical protein
MAVIAAAELQHTNIIFNFVLIPNSHLKGERPVPGAPVSLLTSTTEI